MAYWFSILLFTLLTYFSLPSHAQTCSAYKFSNGKVFSSCVDLPYLGASLYYTRYSSPMRVSTVSIAFKVPQPSSGWVAWGLNPITTTMIGSQAIVAFFHTHGSTIAYPTDIESYSPPMTPAPKLSYNVSDISAEYVKDEMIIYLTLGLVGEGTKFNHVWQKGSSILNDIPQTHSTAGDNILSSGTIDFQ